MTKTEILKASAEAQNATRLKPQLDLLSLVERLTRQQQHQSDDLVNSKKQTSEQIEQLSNQLRQQAQQIERLAALVHKLTALN